MQWSIGSLLGPSLPWGTPARCPYATLPTARCCPALSTHRLACSRAAMQRCAARRRDPAPAPLPLEADIPARIEAVLPDILRTCNEETTTGQDIKRELEKRLGVPVTQHQAFIDAMIFAHAEAGTDAEASGLGAVEEARPASPDKAAAATGQPSSSSLASEASSGEGEAKRGRSGAAKGRQAATGAAASTSSAKAAVPSPAPPSAGPSSAAGPDGDLCVVELSPLKRASVSVYKRSIGVDLRELFVAEDGRKAPGKKGIRLKPEQFRVLAESAPEVNAELEANNAGYVLELGSRRRVTLSPFKGKMRVDVREFYDDGGVLKHGKDGLNMDAEQWGKLVDALPQLLNALSMR